MDRRVLIILIGLVLVLGVSLLFRTLKEPCIAPVLSVQPLVPTAGDSVTFSCTNGDDKEVTWIIDGIDTLYGLSVKHLFDSSGTYSVEASTGEDCFQRMDLVVGNSTRMDTVMPEVEFPEKLISGEPAEFKGLTPDVSWTWSILETGDRISINPFDFTFPTPGKYTLVVEVSGQRKLGIDTFKLKVKRKIPYTSPPKVEEVRITQSPPPPASSEYMTDAEFIEEFVRLANMLGDENHPEVDRLWESKIVSQGVDGAMKLHLMEGKIPREKTLGSFRNEQLINSEPWKVLVVDMITRNSNGAITEVWFKVERASP